MVQRTKKIGKDRITYVDKSTHQCGKVVTRVSYGKPGARPSKGKRKQIRD